MRIGNRLGMVVVGAMLATTTATLAAGADAAKRVQPVPLGGSLADQSGEQHFGVYVPTQFGGELTVKTTAGTIGTIVGPDGRPQGQRAGSRHQRATAGTPSRCRSRATTTRTSLVRQTSDVTDHLRPGRPEPPQALELLLLADQVRRDPRALGRRQRPRRHHAGPAATTSWSPPPAATSRPARTSSAPARTASSRPRRRRATTRPGSPTCTTT